MSSRKTLTYGNPRSIPRIPRPGQLGRGRGGGSSTHLDNSLHSHARLGEDALDVLAAACRLVRNAALDQIALVVRGDLARDEDLGACDYGLRLAKGERGGEERVSVGISCWVVGYLERATYIRSSRYEDTTTTLAITLPPCCAPSPGRQSSTHEDKHSR